MSLKLIFFRLFHVFVEKYPVYPFPRGFKNTNKIPYFNKLLITVTKIEHKKINI